MHRYTVLATDPERAIVALVDDLGKHHVGKSITTPIPPPGLVLNGDAPAVGLTNLKVETGEESCVLCLTLLGCDPQAAVLVITGPPAA